MIDPDWFVRRSIIAFMLAVLVTAALVRLALQGGPP